MWTLLSTHSPFISLGQGSLIGHSLHSEYLKVNDIIPLSFDGRPFVASTKGESLNAGCYLKPEKYYFMTKFYLNWGQTL